MLTILDRAVAPPYEDYYTSVIPELNLSIVYEAAPPQGIDAQGHFFGRTREDVQRRTAQIWLDMSLPEDAFAHTAAHELAHVLQTFRGYYKTSIMTRFGPDTPEARVSVNLAEATECVAVDRELRPFGFDASFSIAARYDAFNEALHKLDRSHPAWGTPMFAIPTLRYVRAALEQPPKCWTVLRSAFKAKLPDVADAAQVLLQMVSKTGLTTVEQRRESMLILRNGLNLKGKVFIENPLTGHKL